VREVFVLPGERRTPTGGNRYHAHLLAALRKAGAILRVMTLEAALHDATRAKSTRYWVDSLLLADVPRLRSRLQAGCELHLLLHWFPSLDPTAGARARRAARRREDRAFDAAHGFLVTSAFSARELARRGVRGRPVLVVPPAPTVRPGGPRRASRGGFRALVVANLVRGKDTLPLLHGLARELGRGAAPDWSLEIAGHAGVEPRYAARCRALVATSPALRGRVRFLGPLGPAALRRAYARNAVFVSASPMETFGMALQEARLFGLYLLVREGGHAGRHVTSPRTGEVLPTLAALCARAAQLARDPAACRPRLAPRPPSAAAPTWEEAAARLIARARLAQRRTA